MKNSLTDNTERKRKHGMSFDGPAAEPLRAPSIGAGLTLLFAVASGVAVGSLYLAQPLIETIAVSFGADASSAAILVTVTQIGYATGIFLLVPLGDVLDRRRLVPAVLGLSGVSLLGAALAPTFGVLLAALGALGLTSVAAQILIPLTSKLAEPE